MRCPTLQELPAPPAGKSGWPWTEESLGVDGEAPSVWPKVSIVTASLNQGAFIEEAIRSVLLQGYPNLEYIICDGGSTDGSVDVIRRYERWLKSWTSEPDQGGTDATRKGFALGSGDLFGIMCADDMYLPNAIYRLALLRLANPQSVICAGANHDIDLARTVLRTCKPYFVDNGHVGDWGVDAWFSGVACLFDAGSYRRVNGLDSRFWDAGDVELWIRLSRLGPISLTNEPVASARANERSLSRQDRARVLAALAAANYVNGYHETAKAILARNVAEVAAESARSLTPADLVRLVGRRGVIRALYREVLPSLLLDLLERPFRFLHK